MSKIVERFVHGRKKSKKGRPKKEKNGRPELGYDQYSDDYKKRKLKLLNESIENLIEEELSQYDSNMVLDWRSSYSNFNQPTDSIDFDAKYYSFLTNNLKQFWNDLPPSSPVKASIIKTLFMNIPAEEIARILNITCVQARSYFQPKNSHSVDKVKPLAYFLNNLGILLFFPNFVLLFFCSFHLSFVSKFPFLILYRNTKKCVENRRGTVYALL